MEREIEALLSDLRSLEDSLRDRSNKDLIDKSYTMNITTVQGFETFMSSLKNKSFRPDKAGLGVDLVLSCVDNYEARMVVNQLNPVLLPEHPPRATVPITGEHAVYFMYFM